jgi:hypothetical protein
MLPIIFYNAISVTLNLGNKIGFPQVFDRSKNQLRFSPEIYPTGVLLYLIWLFNTLFIIWKEINFKRDKNMLQFYFYFPFVCISLLYTTCILPAVLQPKELTQLFNSAILFSEKFLGNVKFSRI